MKFLARFDASQRNAAMDPVKNVNWSSHGARERNVAAKSERSINPLSNGGQTVSLDISFTIPLDFFVVLWYYSFHLIIIVPYTSY